MKFNKKIVVASLSTVMGLSLVGAITGVVAWYQYSTRATASFIGTSVANTGVLQIGKKTGESSYTWYRDLSGDTLTESTKNNKLTPVTFGKIEDNTLPGTAVPGTAYTQPEAGTKAGDTDPYENWNRAEKGKEYLQFDVYLQAKKIANNKTTGADELVALPVYLSDITIADVTEGKLASEAIRIHIAVEGGTTFLISKTEQNQKPLGGYLDLDGDGNNDKVGGYAWDTHRDEDLLYGDDTETQTTKGISDVKATRDSNGGFTNEPESKKILTTSTTGPTKVTITIWLEGWHLYSGSNTAIWEGTKTAETNINVGLTFDVGKTAFDNPELQTN